jgi:hypothetical protein
VRQFSWESHYSDRIDRPHNSWERKWFFRPSACFSDRSCTDVCFLVYPKWLYPYLINHRLSLEKTLVKLCDSSFAYRKWNWDIIVYQSKVELLPNLIRIFIGMKMMSFDSCE